jgi:hypothetical protein
MTERPDIPGEAVDAVQRAINPRWMGRSDVAGDRKKAHRYAVAAAPSLRKQGAEEERERLREAMLQRTGGNLHRAIREVFSEAEAALDTPAPSEPGEGWRRPATVTQLAAPSEPREER